MINPDKIPLGFFSYVHADDTHDHGQLQAIARRLQGEVRAQSGRDFPIFIDRESLKWGQAWRARIRKSLDEVTFLIPVLTPSYFLSEACREEFLKFREREERRERNDLILPIYYIECPILEDAALRANDPIAKALWERQYKDWRPLRHQRLDSVASRQLVSDMAKDLIEASRRHPTASADGHAKQFVITRETMLCPPEGQTEIAFLLKYSTSLGPTLSPAGLAIFIRIESLAPQRELISNLRMEAKAKDGNWIELILIRTEEGPIYFGKDIWEVTQLDLSETDLLRLMVGKYMEPRTMIRGWVFFTYPQGFQNPEHKDLRITVTLNSGRSEVTYFSTDDPNLANSNLMTALMQFKPGKQDLSGLPYVPYRQWIKATQNNPTPST